MIFTKKRLAHIVFESDDWASKTFDIVVLFMIFGSIFVAILDSVGSVRAQYGELLFILEWVFTILFTLEYMLRIWLSRKPRGYIFSFFGMVDLLAILPTYLSFFVVNSQLLTVVRALRLLRVIRILKLGRYVAEAEYLTKSLKASSHKIMIFIAFVLTIVLITGTLMFIVEGPENGFTSIPIGMYWAIVTLTTVGFGDITPSTPLGQLLSSVIMLMGYAIIAVPTGIVSSEMAAQKKKMENRGAVQCPNCKHTGLDSWDEYCKFCGGKLA
ncbi:voltage-gated potassium channel [Algoriphagus ratkowskyi]|uniref:Ion transporter n=1 Tax=Algoriphagus ratkowskyi TaxID=57028 RepID=A0A2W7RD22_9BACT|nr:ion transporter [Algoriphagus ratkowskyi]PZX58324.1 voltage-gated potassium channel [Algoriphagus ratkowskyi]TXD77801.1 ion transporter [Algoriphagus ratkowskyi]